MLSEKRVKEAEKNVVSYLAEGLLQKKPFEQIVFKVLLSNARESLNIANFLAKEFVAEMEKLLS